MYYYYYYHDIYVYLNPLGDISFEYCETEKKARSIASRLCIDDDDVIIVFDKDLHKLFMKSITSSNFGIPEINKCRLSLVSYRSPDCIDNIGEYFIIDYYFIYHYHYY